MESLDRKFLIACVNTLRSYLPKVKEAVELLSEEEIWARPHETSNSVGNILLHMAGNVRQYLISGAGGAADERNRPAEFSMREGASKAELLGALERTVFKACAILEKLDSAQLLETRTIQNREQVLLDAIFHSTEHFCYHAGQIIYIVKARRDHSFPWWKHLEAK
ncbi:DUF1572 domain-containing protein [candidate division KSB1 bacterium]|nr:MAG: DUF1572 domain-containing protein [candidate division KSB1 bacterium]